MCGKQAFYMLSIADYLLKTAILKISKSIKTKQEKFDLAASFQKTILEILNKKTKMFFNKMVSVQNVRTRAFSTNAF